MAAGIGTGYAFSTNKCGAITITADVTSVTATKGTGSVNNKSIGKGDNSANGTQTCGTITIGGVEKEQSEFTGDTYTYAPLELTLSGSYPPDSVMGQSWGFLRQALGVRSGFFDLFPKDENKETEVIAASVSSCLVLVSAALQCCHFLQFVRDSPIDEIVDSDAC